MNTKKITKKYPQFFPFAKKVVSKTKALNKDQLRDLLLRGRSDSRTPLGESSLSERGSIPTTNNNKTRSV